MRFTIPQPELAEAAKWAARQLPTTPLNPVFAGVLLTADDDGVTLSAFDGETAVRARLDGDVTEPGQAVLSARLLSDITGTLGKTDVTVTTTDTDAQVETRTARFDLTVIPLHDYPTLPVTPAATGSVNGSELAAAVARVKMAIARDADGPTAGMSGVRLKVIADRLELTATDRYRIARHTIPWQATGNSADAMGVIPGHVMVANAKSFAGHTVHLSLPTNGSGTAGFDTGRRQVTTMLIESNLFPHKLDRLNRASQASGFFDAEDLAQAIKQVTTVNDGDKPIWITFDGQIATVRARDTGSAQARIDADLEGDLDSIELAFNSRWLLDGLDALTGRVAFDLNTPHTPGVLHDPDDDTYSYLVIPIRDPHKAASA
ncbi:DNA polymerase III subunit beta [Streptomyces microflavus]|uniref:DNA polymerase III subunit beta n=1 Tax=Streptomyces microflavus TaxID=1919 RepID=UPI002E364115|nr:DNA polymerase III subunit beta [Streptomyces microflavus]